MSDERLTQPGDPDVVAHLLRNGAVSKETAVELGSLPEVLPATWRTLLMTGVIREPRPGFYFLADWPGAERPAASPRRVLMTLAFWFLILAIPVAFIAVVRTPHQ